LGIANISKGVITGTVTDIRIIFKHALKAHASQIILAYNHPSGNSLPSEADIQITKEFPNKEVQITLLESGNTMLSVNPKDENHTMFYYIDKQSKLCYFHSIAAPSNEFEFVKNKFNSYSNFTYMGKTEEGWPYWIETVQNTPVYWTLTIQIIGDRPYTVVMCGVNHP
jgi:hypothetical protein